MKKYLMCLMSGIVGSALLCGCNPKTADETPGKTANLVYVNWAEGVAYTHLAQAVLENMMGYEVSITAADVGPAYAAVAQGDKDAFMETWPDLHKDYLDKFKGDFIDLGVVYSGTEVGWVVPDYMTVTKISELNSIKDELNGTITGIDAGAGMMSVSEQLIKDYKLDYKLLASSGPAMTAALKDAVSKQEPIVVLGWKPHWMFARWKLRFLEQDADKVVWDKGDIHITGRKELPQDKPELAAFLSAMVLTDEQLSDLMLQVEESDEDVAVVAKTWMEANKDVVKAWIPAS